MIDHDSAVALATALASIVEGAVKDAVREELGSLQAALAPPRGDGACADRAATQPLLTVEDVAARVKVTQPTVRAWIRAGKLEAHDLTHQKAGRHEYRISEEQLTAFLNEQNCAGKKPFDIEATASNIVRLNRAKGKSGT